MRELLYFLLQTIYPTDIVTSSYFSVLHTDHIVSFQNMMQPKVNEVVKISSTGYNIKMLFT